MQELEDEQRLWEQPLQLRLATCDLLQPEDLKQIKHKMLGLGARCLGRAAAARTSAAAAAVPALRRRNRRQARATAARVRLPHALQPLWPHTPLCLLSHRRSAPSHSAPPQRHHPAPREALARRYSSGCSLRSITAKNR